MGLVESSKGYVFWRLRDAPRSWAAMLVANMPWWWAWALLTPVVFWLAARFRLDHSGWKRPLVVHAFASLLLALVHLAATGVLFFYTTSRHLGFMASPWQQIRGFADAYLAVDIMIYFAVAGSYYAFGFYRRYREKELVASQLEVRMHEARLHALRMELNPHFLFNALNSVAGLVRKGDATAAITVLARLAELLRRTLDRPPTSSLEAELELLRQYLAIERVRFGNRLTVEEQIEPDTLDIQVPTFIYQPLVENAVRHGIARVPGPGQITIGARMVDARLELWVRDNGIGFPEVGATQEGIGLSNTRARLDQLYGDRANLDVRGGDGAGAEVSVIIPVGSQDIRW